MDTEARPMVQGHLQANGKDYYISCWTWLEFMIQVNKMLSEFEIEYPLGEDENMENVKKKIIDTDKFV